MIEPALTAKQWEAKESEVAYLDPGLIVQVERYEDYPSVNIPDGIARHGLAALALYQQTFGFTAEDVRFLRDAGMLVDGDIADGLADIAERIEALLPPEGK